ncbi:energy transducer TonB [Pontimicrobium sp. SW4]|uniref:Energy transducer TonB n=1 Tax=Pontimicrobium sp. SW4 TaxID=3153519 RepID=A0AAU7BR43_9FLAO
MKTSQKHDANLQKNSTLYFQVGLILTLLATYGLFEMQFQIKSIPVITYPVDTDDTIYVNYVPKPTPEPAKAKKVEPVRKKLLAISFKPIDNNSPTKEPTKDVVTEPIPLSKPTVNKKPGKPAPAEKSTYSIIGVEQVPIYPGCEDFQTNDELRNCMSKKIGRLIGRKFDSDLISELGFSDKQKVYVQFTIDELGNVTQVKARAPHKRLENEAIKVIHKIPKMIPAKQSNKEVAVMYSIPITLKVQ